MASQNEPGVTRKTLIQSLVLVLLVIVGLVLFFAIGNRAVPLLRLSELFPIFLA